MLPYGYRVRLATSWHAGGWKPCKGLPDCAKCRTNSTKHDTAKATDGTRVQVEDVSARVGAGNL